MSLIPPETIEQIIASNDIVDVVGGYFPLKRSGPVFKALCPFHQERTPSFTVNSQRQMFKCFGCGAGGNAIRFVMTYENLDFLAAARKLAERAGIRIEQGEMSKEDAARYSMRRRLLALHAEAADFFHLQLMKKPSAQIAREYLTGRGIGREVAKSWKVGYAPDAPDTLRNFAHSQGYSDEELVASGLVKPPDDDHPHGGFYERFRGRLMFPICNDSGEVIAFSGRVLQADAKGGKYVNSPETLLFTKGAVLFGLHKSKRAIIGKASAIVLEGQLDLITAFESGVENVVAPQGTAFTEEHARKIKRCFPDGLGEVVLCFDADAAGEKAAEKTFSSILSATASVLSKENILIKVAEMPPGEDPDSMIRGKGASAFIERIAAAKDFFDFQMDRLAEKPEFQTPRGKMQAARKMADSISLIKDAMMREAVMNKVTQRLEVSTQEFVRLLKAPTPRRSESDEPAPAPNTPTLADPTIRLLALVALRDAAAREWLLDESWDRMLGDDPEAVLLVKILGSDLDPAEPSSIHVFLSTLEAAEESVISGLLEDKAPGSPLTIAHDCWRELERRQIRRRIDSLLARQRNPNLPESEQTNLQKQILDLKNRLSDIARPLSPPL